MLRRVLLRAVETSGYKDFIFKALIRKQVTLGSSESHAGLSVTHLEISELPKLHALAVAVTS